MERQGQRLLLALTSQTDIGDTTLSTFYNGGILAALGGVLCLICIVLMCTCKDGKHKDENEDIELQQGSRKGEKKSLVQVSQDGSDIKSKTDIEVVSVNGTTSQVVSTMPGHSRQASSGSAHMRPTSLRELPEPPVSNHHTRNKSLSGVELPSMSIKNSGTGSTTGAGDVEYAYPQHVHHTRNNKNISSASTEAKEKAKAQNDGYDHLGPKPSIKPTNYDNLLEPESTDGETPVSETGGGLGGHYSQLRERTYAVVVDVKAKAKELFDPYSKVKDKEDTNSNYYSQVKEEDPYNHIGDSDGAVSMSFIRCIRQSRELEDLYSTVQDESGVDLKATQDPRGNTGRGIILHSSTSTSSRTPTTPPASQNIGDIEDEYAVVQKGKDMSEHVVENDEESYLVKDVSLYSMGPPEPPRLYNDYDSAEDAFPNTVTTKFRREHKYSKVTARESLASMSARNALNPYESVADLPENTYATVEGGSGDGVVLRGGTIGDDMEKRISQSSDTYAEIGISGGGLSSSIISTSSSTGGNHNSSNSSAAPVPPSLDSLHLMTKSQTSSEGDRLSDRHLASPEDSGMSLNLWGDSQDEAENGYSTLKKLERSPQAVSLPTIPGPSFIKDEDSGEVTLVPNYQTVKDCISDSEAMEEADNDPNYESVEETRAKVALLKARDNSTLDSRNSTFASPASVSSHTSVVQVVNTNNGLGGSGDLKGDDELIAVMRQRRRRLDHDYEEVDLSPPSSPVSQPASIHHTSTSAYHITSVSTSASISSAVTTPPDPVTETNLDLIEARERAIQSHMYEELTEVRARSSEMSRAKKGSSLPKSSSEEKKKMTSGDKKKGEDKQKLSNEGKRKHGSEDKRKSSGEDKKKYSHEEKRKVGTDDKKKTNTSALNGTRL